MVRTKEAAIDLDHVDLSIMPSLECNLECSFCMYGCGPGKKRVLEFVTTARFLEGVDWNGISSFGFYGGEPSINMGLYQVFVDLIPSELRRFTISNGAWSRDYDKTMKFLTWCTTNWMRLVVSGTPEHIKHQDRIFLSKLEKEFGGNIYLKEDDDLHPMGRLAKDKWGCTEKCRWHPQPIRLAIFPTGDIIMQNCDGVYPVVGNYEDPPSEVFHRARMIRKFMCIKGCKNINQVMEQKD